MPTEAEQQWLDRYADYRKTMNEIRARDLAQTENLMRLQNLSIYLNALGRDDQDKLRPHAIEMMLRGLAGEVVS